MKHLVSITGGAVVAYLLLERATALVAGSRAALPAEPPVAGLSGWKPPSHFDVLKELNAQTGRLATLVGLLVAAITFTTANGPLREVLTNPSQLSGNRLARVVDVILLAWDLGVAAVGAALAMYQAVPTEVDHEDAWKKLIARKRGWCRLTEIAIPFTLGALMTVWLSGADSDVDLVMVLASGVGSAALFRLAVFPGASSKRPA